MLVNLVLMPNEAKKLDNSLYSEGYTMGILVVSNVKGYGVIFDLICQEQKVYIVCSYKEGLVTRYLVLNNQ